MSEDRPESTFDPKIHLHPDAPELECNRAAMLNWVLALESGTFSQTRDCLGRESRDRTNDKSERTYCCLGVAYTVTPGVRTAIRTSPDPYGTSLLELGGYTVSLPGSSVQWLGLIRQDEAGVGDPIVGHEYRWPPLNDWVAIFVPVIASGANDGGRWTFGEIARSLRHTYLRDGKI